MAKVRAFMSSEYDKADVFPEVPAGYDDTAPITTEDCDLGMFVVSDSGTVLEVIDIFTTADDFRILLTVNADSEVEFWSSEAWFYRIEG